VLEPGAALRRHTNIWNSWNRWKVLLELVWATSARRKQAPRRRSQFLGSSTCGKDDGLAARQSGACLGNVSAEFGVPLFCRTTRPNSFEPVCSAAASGLGGLSSVGVLASRACTSLRSVGCWS
jgi:hypothetical protein